MNRPPVRDYVIGNPLTVFGAVACCAVAMRQCWNGDLPWPGGLIAWIVMGCSLNASERIRAYRTWQRAWESMGPTPHPRHGPTLRGAVIVVLLLLIGIAATTPDEHTRSVAVILLTVFAVAIVICALLRRRHGTATKKEAEQPTVVSICVAGALIDVPPLSVAYQQLPAYCMAALNRGLPSKE